MKHGKEMSLCVMWTWEVDMDQQYVSPLPVAVQAWLLLELQNVCTKHTQPDPHPGPTDKLAEKSHNAQTCPGHTTKEQGAKRHLQQYSQHSLEARQN